MGVSKKTWGGVKKDTHNNISLIKEDKSSSSTSVDDLNSGDTKHQEEKNLFFDLVEKLGYGRDRVRLTPERMQKLKKRLKTFSREQMLGAAAAIRDDEFMQGKNDNNKRYGTIDYLLRKDEKVEQWLSDSPEEEPLLLPENDDEMKRFRGEI